MTCECHPGQLRRFSRTCDRHVNVIDTTDSAGNFPIGKQAQNPSHIFYTACTGIWQGVWIEAAPSDHITQLDMHGSTSGEGERPYQPLTGHN